MTTLRKMLEEHLAKSREKIIKIRLDGRSTDYGRRDSYAGYKKIPFGKLMSYAEALPYIDVEFDDDYGNQGCPDFICWTDKSVVFLHEYDGAVWLRSVPRKPEKNI